ncbi:natterin-3-like [Xyrichtys novacula]|uniref:Natterin-3-like n=1 Tax=Xyrichtys novacula TaxID=13765 RepID=A0AAV1G9L7_XYRNO|nr:natterin-3-like [Xyrichtys novacula]
MEVFVLLLSSLLTLSSASLKEKIPQSEEVTLEDRSPETTPNRSVLPPLTPADLQRNRTSKSTLTRHQSLAPVWVTMSGSVPSSAVFIYNPTRGTDYVCRYRCLAGFYNPKLGHQCHYPYSGRERLGSPFQILVRRGAVNWKNGSFGLVPKNSVRTCNEMGLFVGRVSYGLGMVRAANKACFVPRNGHEFVYRHYQVLTFN